MAATVTLTGTAGPQLTVAAAVFTEVNSILIDTNQNLITLYKSGQIIQPISVAAAATVTATKSGSNWTLTIS